MFTPVLHPRALPDFLICWAFWPKVHWIETRALQCFFTWCLSSSFISPTVQTATGQFSRNGLIFIRSCLCIGLIRTVHDGKNPGTHFLFDQSLQIGVEISECQTQWVLHNGWVHTQKRPSKNLAIKGPISVVFTLVIWKKVQLKKFAILGKAVNTT